MERNIYTLPTIAMRGIVVFPYMQLNFDVARTASVKAIEAASAKDSRIFLVTQKDPEIEKPATEDLYNIGTIAVIKQIMHLPGNVTRIIVKGVSRAVVNDYRSFEPYIETEVMEINEIYSEISDVEEAYCRALKRKAEELAHSMGQEWIEEFEFYNTIEELAPIAFEEYKKISKVMCANVDFYSGLVYTMLNIPKELYTPIFAISRIAGWSAHRLEELAVSNRIIRPAYKNVGGKQPYVNLMDREE